MKTHVRTLQLLPTTLCLALAFAVPTLASPAVIPIGTDLEDGTASGKTVLGTLAKAAEPDRPVCTGEVVRYTVTLTNTSDSGPLAALICDPIPAGTTYVDGSAEGGAPAGGGAGPCIRWQGQLASGDSHSVSFSVTVGAPSGASVVNRASGRLGNGQGVVELPLEVECPPEPGRRRPLIVIPGAMGTFIEATDNLSDTVRTGTNLWPGEVADTGIPTPLQSTYYLLEFTPAGKPKHPTDIPIWAQHDQDAFDPTRSPMVDKAGIDFYDATLAFLEHQGGYALGKTLFAYGWDWRKGAGWKDDDGRYQNVADLDGFIDKVLQIYRAFSGDETADKVDILAHSQGGYVAWLYLGQKPDAAAKVASLITVGTPYLGSPKATATLLWGVSYQRLLLGANAATTKRISHYMPGVAELVPPAEFIHYLDDRRNFFNRGRRKLPSGTVLGDVIPDRLNNRRVIQKALDLRRDLHAVWKTPPAGIDVYAIAGTGKPSWANVIVPARGKAYANLDLYGDETVPFFSQMASHVLHPGVPRFMTRNQEHVESFTGGTSMKIALNLLRRLDPLNPGAAGFPIPPADAHRFGTPGSSDFLRVKLTTGFQLLCPLHIELVDASGNRTGPLPGGGLETGIPDSSWSDLGLSESKTIYAPSDGRYTVRLESYADQDDVFDLAIVDRDEDGRATGLTAFIDVPVTPETRGRLDLESSSGLILFLDQDGDGTFEERHLPDLAGGGDRDGDGLIDGVEIFYYDTDPDQADSDGDGASDGDEVHVLFSDPLNEDLPPETTFLLNDGRFRVEVEWRDFENRTGDGRTVTMSSADSGLFWFFDPDNWEVLVKVLDGCGFNDHFWVFSAATTNVEYTLRVTDTRTGATTEYFNPLGNEAPAITDTAAFATCGEHASADARRVHLAQSGSGGLLTTDSAAGTGSETEAAAKRGGCLDSPTLLCVDDRRFQIEAEWRDFEGNTGSAQLVPFRAADSGIFWFFDPDNWEMLVKVLDGCAFNDRFWVFSAATTNVEYTLRVTDTEANVVKEYLNPLGRAADALTDTDAFATCP